MSLLDVLRSGVAIADSITKPLQATVMYEHCTGSNEYGPTYAAAVPIVAIVDEKQRQIKTKGGMLTASNAQLTFLNVADIIAATGTVGGIREADVITLPDGTNGMVMAIGGFVDAGTGHPVATEAWIG